jgi:hypothetical protein
MSRWDHKVKTADPRRLSIFDQQERKAVEGIELSYRNAPTYWKSAAAKTLRELCKLKSEFTADDFWELLATKGIHTGEPRALGAVIRGAERSGMIKATGNYLPSRRRHKSPIMLWQSNIYRRQNG